MAWKDGSSLDPVMRLELIPGMVIEGELSKGRESQYGMSRYIRTAEGCYWVPNVAALEDLMDTERFPAGTLVRLKFKGMATSKSGNGRSYQDWIYQYDDETVGGSAPAEGGKEGEALPF
jgi:hypothetical protein